MPLYEYSCIPGCSTQRWLTLSQHAQLQTCDRHGYVMTQIISAPLLIKVSSDVCYDSPIDGNSITSWQARQEDLKRNNCTEYDPGSKQDYTNRLKDAEAQLDQSIESSVEETIAKMPTAKRGKLYSELVDQGVNADVVRMTPNG